MRVSMQSSLLYNFPPMYYTLMVYIDPKVQPPFPKQDVTKYPKVIKQAKVAL